MRPSQPQTASGCPFFSTSVKTGYRHSTKRTELALPSLGSMFHVCRAPFSEEVPFSGRLDSGQMLGGGSWLPSAPARHMSRWGWCRGQHGATRIPSCLLTQQIPGPYLEPLLFGQGGGGSWQTHNHSPLTSTPTPG